MALKHPGLLVTIENGEHRRIHIPNPIGQAMFELELSETPELNALPPAELTNNFQHEAKGWYFGSNVRAQVSRPRAWYVDQMPALAVRDSIHC